MRTMTVLKVTPGGTPELITIENSESALKKEIGGDIQILHIFFGDVVIVCSENNNSKELKENFPLFDGADVVLGTAIFVGKRGDMFRGLSSEELTKVINFVFKMRDLMTKRGKK